MVVLNDSAVEKLKEFVDLFYEVTGEERIVYAATLAGAVEMALTMGLQPEERKDSN